MTPPNRGWLSASSTLFHQPDRKVGRAFVVSMLLHGVGLALVVLWMSLVPERVFEAVPEQKYDLVFVRVAGLGGGGGGNNLPDAPRKLEMKAEAPKPARAVMPRNPRRVGLNQRRDDEASRRPPDVITYDGQSDDRLGDGGSRLRSSDS